MSDADRALNLLLHDIRTPLGVAAGYLRLMRDARLATPEDREKAIVQSLDALGRISRLCDDAAAFVSPAQTSAGGRVAARTLAEAVAVRAGTRGLSWTTPELAAASTVPVGASTDRMADAILVILCTVAPPGAGHGSVEMEHSELRFVAGRDRTSLGALAGAPQPFDPWHGHGLGLPLACRVVAQAGGRVWSAAGQPGTVAVALPLEPVRV